MKSLAKLTLRVIGSQGNSKATCRIVYPRMTRGPSSRIIKNSLKMTAWKLIV